MRRPRFSKSKDVVPAIRIINTPEAAAELSALPPDIVINPQNTKESWQTEAIISATDNSADEKPATGKDTDEKPVKAKKSRESSIHVSHRKRMKSKFMRAGLEAFEEHELLEMVLYYAYPRGDTNLKAHELLKEYGSLSTLFYTPAAQLKKSVSENFAFAVKFMMEITKFVDIQRSEAIPDDDFPKYLQEILSPLYRYTEREVVYAFYLDNRSKLIGKEKIYEGTAHWTDIPFSKVLEGTFKYNSQNVLIAHNHPYGNPNPSHKDITTTKDLQKRLAGAHITLSDHIIVSSRSEIASMRALGYMQEAVLY